MLVPGRKIIAEPPIIETLGAPEFFLSGSVSVITNDVIHIIGYVERIISDNIERIEVMRCHMGKTDYAENLARAVARMRSGAH